MPIRRPRRVYDRRFCGHGGGRDERFPDDKLLPFLKHGGYVYIAIPGMKKDCHDHLHCAAEKINAPLCGGALSLDCFAVV